MPTLYLVRHGQTDWNAQGRLQGHADRPLDTVGRIQASAVASRLSSIRLDSVIASDLARARSTASAIAVYHGLTVKTDPRLREVGFGSWEGLRMSDIAAAFPEALAGWREDPPSYLPPGAESPEAVRRRVASFLDDMRQRRLDEHILVVAHGASLRVLLSMVSPWPEGRRRRSVVDTASISKVQVSRERGTILVLNDRSHLAEIDQLVDAVPVR